MRRARLGKGGGGGGKNGRFSHFFLLDDFPPPSQEPGTGYDGGGSEHVTLNWIPFFFFLLNFFAFLSNSLTMSVYVSFPAVNFLRTIPIVQKREKTTCRKSKFHVLVVQWRRRNVQKSAMHVQSCFAYQTYSIAFWCSHCGRLCWRSLILASGYCHFTTIFFFT